MIHVAHGPGRVWIDFVLPTSATERFPSSQLLIVWPGFPGIIPPMKLPALADPRAAESLALAVLRAISERFDLMDKYIVDFLARHSDEPEKRSEWASFRGRMFDEQGV